MTKERKEVSPPPPSPKTFVTTFHFLPFFHFSILFSSLQKALTILKRALDASSVVLARRGGFFALAGEVGGLRVRGGGGSGRGGSGGGGFSLVARSPSLSSRSTMPAANMTTSASSSASLVWASLESALHDCANNQERPDRVRAAASGLEGDELASICRRVGLETTATATTRARAAATAVHSRAYLPRLQALCDQSRAAQKPLKVADEDDETEFTYLTSTSLDDAIAAVETALSLWDLVDPSSSPASSSGRPPRAALALVRPPGHHAGRGVDGAEADSPSGAPSGFCLVNTAAAVARSIATGGASSSSSRSSSSSDSVRIRNRSRRVLVIDWDVHVGDGTQDIFWGGHRRIRSRGRRRSGGGEEYLSADGERGDGEEQEEAEEQQEEGGEEEESVCVIDLHEAGAWPGGGGIELRGNRSRGGIELETGDGRTTLSRVVNVPLPSGSGDATARLAFERIIVPVAARFKPEAIVVSAGFDAHELEPLAGLKWKDETFQFLGASTAALAEKHGCGLLFALEGGYSRSALRSAVAALAKGAATLEVPEAVAAEGGEEQRGREGEAAISAVVEEHGL